MMVLFFGQGSSFCSCVFFSADTVIHFMTAEERKRLELEKLWTLGEEFDDQYLKMAELRQVDDRLQLKKSKKVAAEVDRFMGIGDAPQHPECGG